jgi:hypothetical protein
MADSGFQITVTGMDKVKSNLLSLALKGSLGTKIATHALEVGGAIMQDAVKERAPVRTTPWSGRTKNLSWNLPPGALKSDVQLYVGKNKEGEGVKATIIAGRYTLPVSRWVEFGHLVRRKKGRGRALGAFGPPKPHPYIRPAFEATASASYEAVRATILEDVARISKEFFK